MRIEVAIQGWLPQLLQNALDMEVVEMTEKRGGGDVAERGWNNGIEAKARTSIRGGCVLCLFGEVGVKSGAFRGFGVY